MQVSSRNVFLVDFIFADICRRMFCRLVGVYGPIFTFFAQPGKIVLLITDCPRTKMYREEAKPPKLSHNLGGNLVTSIVILLLVHLVQSLLGHPTSNLMDKGKTGYLRDMSGSRGPIVLNLCTYEALAYTYIETK